MSQVNLAVLQTVKTVFRQPPWRLCRCEVDAHAADCLDSLALHDAS